MISKIKEKVGLKGKKKRKYPRGVADDKICISILEGYKPGVSKIKYGACFSTRTFNVSAGGLCVGHPDKLMPGAYVMVNSRDNLKRVECLSCVRCDIIDKDFTFRPVIGKIVWRSINRAGIKFIEISDSDKRKLDKKAKSSF
jgi:hypothetical protein